ncbi:MAG: hypothetical protein H6811_04400 [Phycisphaeraceae bacterium]|nr:hypothetical protein [Phycisphaeraceae bacterium]
MRLSDVMGGAGLAIFPEIALVLFLVVFALVSLRTVRQPRATREDLARLPLADDAVGGVHSGKGDCP